MNLSRVFLCFALLSPAGDILLRGQNAEPQGATVELPPMLVEETTSSAPWLYVSAGGMEFLSRCSASTTRSLVEAWIEKLQLVRSLVPDTFLGKMEVPTVFVLYTQSTAQPMSAEIQRELQAGAGQGRSGDASRTSASIAPSMRLSDVDMHASIAYIDETLFDASRMSVSPGHVRFLLNGRVPDLPPWLIEGLDRTYRRAEFVEFPITLAPLVWHNASESEALANDSSRPRALLPPNELFAVGTLRAEENRHPRRVEARASTQELFVRWAIASGGEIRETFWRFAERAAETTVTEELFEAFFGFDFAELRDRLSDYLPKAVSETTRVRPGRQPPLPRIELERATPNQIARVRGEWERLAIGHVQRRLPEVREPYIAQARRTLRRAYDAGDRDPRLLATMGLCEIDAGNEAGALQFLEPAVLGGVVRPRAHYELARLRFAALTGDAPDTKRFSFTELAPILQPLQRGLTQAPPLGEMFALLGEAWARCEIAPTTAEFAELELGARLFPTRPTVAYPIAHALARHGKTTEAAAVLAACAPYVAEEPMRGKIARLQSELGGPQGER